MFKFSTCTILNNFVDANGVNKVVSTDESLTIHRLGKFCKDNVTKIFKREGTDGEAGTATIACDVANYPSKGTTETPAGIYRLKLYVKLSGNNDAYYANDFVFKGKPYVYEFEVKGASATATDVADAAEAAINRLASRFNDKVFKVENDGAGTLTLTTVGADNVYRNIVECVLQKFDNTIASALIGGEYVDVVEGEMTPCVNPFGNYTQIIKDLRLPTQENTSWTSPNKEEMPLLGTIYNQYLIYMAVNRGIMGGDAVGEITTSVTAHSIWVPQDKATEFEGYLAKLGTVTEFNEGYEAAVGDPTDPSDDDASYKPVTEPDVTVAE